jgi:hypothetical protein
MYGRTQAPMQESSGVNRLDHEDNNPVLYTQPLKMELTEGSETSANHNMTPGKYVKE